MSRSAANGRKRDGEDNAWGEPVLRSVMYKMSTIALNIQVDGKSQAEVKNIVVEFLQNVHLCKEDGSR